jgi:hypothetical protein
VKYIKEVKLMDISWDEYALIKLLNGLDDQYEGYLTALRLSTDLSAKLPSADDLIQRVMDEERRQGEGDKIKEETVNATQRVKARIIRNKNTKELCEKCGHSEHDVGRYCSALNAVCHGCGKKGHFKVVCNDLEEQKQERSSIDVGAVEVNSVTKIRKEKFILNSGANEHVVNSMDDFKEWEKDDTLICMANGEVV